MLNRFVCVLLLLASFSGGAAPLKRSDVPARPDWIIHIDCDALRPTYLGKYLIYQMDKPEVNSNMIAFQTLMTFDLRTQLHGVTVYGDGLAKDGVYIVYADITPARLITSLEAAPEAEATTVGHQVIYSWTDKEGRKYAAVQKTRMIAAKEKEAVLGALAVIEGTAPNLSSTATLADIQAGDFLQADARKLDVSNLDPMLALLKNARRVRLRAGEHNEQLNATLTLETPDESTAQQLSIVAQGMNAMFSLQGESAAGKIANGLTIRQSGAAVIATLSVPSTVLVSAWKSEAAKKEKKKGQ